MVQSFNLDGIRMFYKAVISPQLIKPAVTIKDFRDIDFRVLRQKYGVRYIGFDLDNCLSKPYDNRLAPLEGYAAAWDRLIEEFGARNVVIVSNSVGTGDDPGHLKANIVEENFGVSVLRHSDWKKPSVAGGTALLTHFSSLSKSAPTPPLPLKANSSSSTGINVKPGEVCFVGDRLLTDIMFGNLAGFVTVLTRQPIDTARDNIAAKFIRSAEHLYLGITKKE